jgi:hypothetical protein
MLIPAPNLLIVDLGDETQQTGVTVKLQVVN